MRIENHFHINSFALSLAKKQKLVQLGKGLLRCDKNELYFSTLNIVWCMVLDSVALSNRHVTAFSSQM